MNRQKKLCKVYSGNKSLDDDLLSPLIFIYKFLSYNYTRRVLQLNIGFYFITNIFHIIYIVCNINKVLIIKYGPFLCGSFYGLAAMIFVIMHEKHLQNHRRTLNQLLQSINVNDKEQKYFEGTCRIVRTFFILNILLAFITSLFVFPIWKNQENIVFMIHFFYEHYPKYAIFFSCVYCSTIVHISIYGALPPYTAMYYAMYGVFITNVMQSQLKKMPSDNQLKEGERMNGAKKGQELVNNNLKQLAECHCQLKRFMIFTNKTIMHYLFLFYFTGLMFIASSTLFTFFNLDHLLQFQTIITIMMHGTMGATIVCYSGQIVRDSEGSGGKHAITEECIRRKVQILQMEKPELSMRQEMVLITSGESDYFFEELASSPWYGWNMKNRRLFITFLTLSTRTSTLKASTFITLDLEIIIVVFKFLASVAALANSLRQKI